MDEIISILRDIAAGRKNQMGDYWHTPTYVAEAADQLEKLRSDAERYRWLRNPPMIHPLPAWIAGQGDEFRDEDWLTGEEADEVIDAAMNGANG